MTTMENSSDEATQNEEAKFQNNLVASSDYRQALNGINEYFENEQKELTKKMNNHIETTEDDTVLTMNLLRKHLIKSSSASLQQNFTRIAQDIPDEEFHQLMEKHYPPLIDDDRSTELDEKLQRLRGEYEAIDEEEEEEVEEEDLVDAKALKQAQELREKVRALSARVEELRGSVVLRACNIAESDSESSRQIRSSDHLPNLSIPDNLMGEDGATSTEIYKSMEGLAKLVNHPKLSEMPYRLNVLQETMDVIQNETAPAKTLSQTESTIVSRVNEKENVDDARQRDLLTPMSPIDEESSPQDRLAEYLAAIIL